MSGSQNDTLMRLRLQLTGLEAANAELQAACETHKQTIAVWTANYEVVLADRTRLEHEVFMLGGVVAMLRRELAHQSGVAEPLPSPIPPSPYMLPGDASPPDLNPKETI